ncbi:MAG: SEC-C metal-binding domain-containing protein [Gemmatimonadaceae bacterium]
MDNMFEHTAVGRNDPCPCGSGRTYRKCSRGAEVGSTTRFPRWTGLHRSGAITPCQTETGADGA